MTYRTTTAKEATTMDTALNFAAVKLFCSNTERKNLVGDITADEFEMMGDATRAMLVDLINAEFGTTFTV